MATATLRSGSDTFTTIAIVEAELTAMGQIVELVRHSTDEVISDLPGFGMACVHVNAENTQMAELIQWRSAEDFQRFIQDPERSGHTQKVGELAGGQTFGTYRSGPVFAGIDGNVATISTDGDSVYTGVIVLDAQEGKQQWICDYNSWETERVIRSLPGFVSASFFLGHDARKVAEYVQWASKAHFEEAWVNPDFAEHLPVTAHYAGIENVGWYQVVHVAAAEG
jgi:heme-degrading monooxygenase HmoA